MAAYLVKILPWAAGLGIMGSGTIALASYHATHEFEQKNLRLEKEKEELLRDTRILRTTNKYLIDEVENYKIQQNDLMLQLEGNRWTTKLVGVGATALGGVVGYSMR
jgi:hypothetical protein